MIVSDIQARQHLRINAGEDDGNLELYVAAAEKYAQAYLDRNVYADDASLTAAIAAIPATLGSAQTAYDAAVAAAALLGGGIVQDAAYAQACAAYEFAQDDARRTMCGIVTDELMAAATLLILGHLYTNRSSVVAAVGISAAIEIPVGSKALLAPYRVMGV